jgi:hypothetical protein
LQIVERDGSRTVRDVSGVSCSEVVEALTLVARIAIDPQQALVPSDAAEPSTQDSPKQQLPPAARARSPARPIQSARADRATEVDEGGRWRPAIGGQVLATTLWAPPPAIGAALFAEGLTEPARSLGARVALRGFASGDVAIQSGTARLVLALVNLSACAPRWLLARALVLCPTLGFEGGLLLAEGSQTESARTATRPWFAGGVGLRLDVSVGQRIFAGADAELSLPLVRDSFVFGQPPTTAHAIPAVGLVAGLGAGYRFP